MVVVFDGVQFSVRQGPTLPLLVSISAASSSLLAERA
jgi:hypothetical protein